MRRLAASITFASMLMGVLAPAALAAPPAHEPAPDLPPLSFAAGEVCADPITLEITDYTAKSTTFAPARDGSIRILERGWAENEVRNDATGESVMSAGGYMTSIVIDADGAVHVRGTGAHFAWYFEGDVSDLAPGFWGIWGHATEDYAGDGTFLFATFSGRAIDFCAAVGAD